MNDRLISPTELAARAPAPFRLDALWAGVTDVRGLEGTRVERRPIEAGHFRPELTWTGVRRINATRYPSSWSEWIIDQFRQVATGGDPR